MTDKIPDEWAQIATMTKTPMEWPSWPVPSPQLSSAYGKLHSTAGETIQIVVPLAESAGPGLEGVRLRITVRPYRREFDVTATLECLGGRSHVTLARVDAWPHSRHPNVHWRSFSGLPPMIEGHHVHRYADNAKIGRKAFAPYGNLPVAWPLEPIPSFREFLRIVSREFHIDGVETFQSPDWSSLI